MFLLYLLLVLSFFSCLVTAEKFVDFDGLKVVLRTLGCFDADSLCGLKSITDNCSMYSDFINCDDSGNVQQLNLFDANLKGKLDGLSTLKSLQHINLPNNSITGNLSSLIGLKDLQYLNLALNKIDGSIPQQMSQLGLLSAFFVQGNDIKGFVPQMQMAFDGSCIIQSSTFPGNCVEQKVGGCNVTCVCDPLGAVCGGTTMSTTASETKAKQTLPTDQSTTVITTAPTVSQPSTAITTITTTVTEGATTKPTEEPMTTIVTKSLIDQKNSGIAATSLYIIIAVLGGLLFISIGVIIACNVKLQRLKQANVEQPNYIEVVNSSSSSGNNGQQSKPNTNSNIYDVVSEVQKPPVTYDLAPMPSQAPVYGQSSLSAIRLTPPDE